MVVKFMTGKHVAKIGGGRFNVHMPQLIEWDEQYSVGIKSIDEQHKRLVSLINQLHEAMTKGKGNEILGKVLQDLVTYTKTHFANEERLMTEHKYPSYIEHKRIHDELVSTVVDLNGKFRSGNRFLTAETMTFLKTWLTGHIMGVDKKYGPYLCQKGVV